MEKLYILVDEQLDLAYQGVQGGHALAQWLIENPNQTWNNQTLIYLKANLNKEIMKLDQNMVKYTVFKEPDLDNQITAVALQHDKFFKHLNLMGS